MPTVSGQDSLPPVPLLLRLPYTALVVTILVVYWRHAGPQNFLWFSDLALFYVLAALWLRSALLVSLAAVSVLAFELIWTLDFLVHSLSGQRWMGLTGYVYDPAIALPVRVLSVIFHLSLVVLIPWLLWRGGYDARAFRLQTGIAWLVLPLSRWASNASQNVNWTYGLGRSEQQWLPGWAWVGLLMLALPVLVYWPSHWLLRRVFGSKAPDRETSRESC